MIPSKSKAFPYLAAFTAVMLVVSAVSAWSMYSLNSQEMLWGYRPFWFLLCSWLGIAGLILLAGRGRIQWRRIGLATLSAVLLSLGFPGILPVPWLAFAGFVPLLILEKELKTARENGSKARLFPYLYFALVLWNILTTFWVADSSLAAGLFAILANALLMCIPFLLFQLTNRVIPRLGYAAFAAYWISFEYLHLNWDLTWPWLTLGNFFAQVPATVQWYEFTGVFGGSLWILVMNILLSQAYEERQQTGRWRRNRIMQIGLLGVTPVAVSLVQYFTFQAQGHQQAEVLIVQPNYEPFYEKFTLPEDFQLNGYIDLTRSRLDSTVDYIVYPESAFRSMETDRINDYPTTIRLRKTFAAYPGLSIVTGLDAYHIFGSDEPHTGHTRTHVGADGRTMFYETYNLAAQLTIGQEEVQQYKKSKLVPGPENFPFKRILFFMEPVVEQLGGTAAGLGTQPRRSVFTKDRFRIAPVICYESVFGEYFAGYVRAGAQAAFIVTNDGWWDNTPGHRQHLYFASLRAIETRRPIARSANTGISAFINQRGDIEQSLPYGVDGTLRQSIRLNDGITFYVRWGDLIARIAMFLAALLLLATLVNRYRNSHPTATDN